jgi:hypothetical protein
MADDSAYGEGNAAINACGFSAVPLEQKELRAVLPTIPKTRTTVTWS